MPRIAVCVVALFYLGLLLPGDVIKFPFIFKSPNAGIFSEQWEFQTHPLVCGGAKLLVTLRGVALKQDKYEEQRNELEVACQYDTIRYDTRCYFNVHSKANMSQLNLPHGNDN